MAPPTHVHLAPLPFLVVWLCIGAVHAVSLVAMLEMRRLYASLPYTSLGETLSFIQLGIAPAHGPAVARVLDALIALHAVSLASMALSTLWRRRLSFGSLHDGSWFESIASRRQRAPRIQRRATLSFRNAWLHVFGRRGVLGVEGTHFDSVLLAREAVETELQSLQAYRMSRFVGHQWLNWMYVALLVLNCWGIPLLHHTERLHTLRRRLWCLFCDALLDFSASVAVPTALFLRYKSEYDPALGNFAAHLWYDDVWTINVTYDFQLVLVVSWSDLAMRVVMALSLVTSLESIKRLVRLGGAVTDAMTTKPQAIVVAPSAPTTGSIRLSEATPPLLAAARHRLATSLHHIAHRTFAVWGLVVLVLHLHAQMQPSVANCGLQLRPWLLRGAACALPILDCTRLDINGSRDDIAALWRQTHAATVSKIVIRHCAALEIPRDIDRFSEMTTVTLYNSTIVSWSEDAALRRRSHPSMFVLTLVRVSFPNGELPPGLVAVDGPPSLLSIQICTSNLRQLPLDLDQRWPTGLQLLIEDSHLREFPVVLTRLRPTHLSLAYNRIAVLEIQSVLSWDGLQQLSLAGTTALTTLTVSPLNESLPAVETMRFLVLSQTNVEWLPRWIDRIFERGLTGSWTLTALTGTPFCVAVDQLRRGIISTLADALPVLHQLPPEDVSQAMSVTHDQLPILDAVVACTTVIDGRFYPIWYDDLANGLSR
ncbi:hypothetical protein PINS_up000903 [Pythium insidiosum]|nr:hypothetical protein PINS_up000903 [Pythium insidiosum]